MQRGHWPRHYGEKPYLAGKDKEPAGIHEASVRQTRPQEVQESPRDCCLWEAIRGLDRTNDVLCPCLLLGILGRWDKKRRIWLWQMSLAGVRASQAAIAGQLTTFSACVYMHVVHCTQICWAVPGSSSSQSCWIFTMDKCRRKLSADILCSVWKITYILLHIHKFLSMICKGSALVNCIMAANLFSSHVFCIFSLGVWGVLLFSVCLFFIIITIHCVV